MKDMDCLIVIGSTLETGFAIRKVSQAMEIKSVDVIQINPECTI